MSAIPPEAGTNSESDPLPTEGRLAGIDYGTVRVGIAICDPGQEFCSPYENSNRRTDELDRSYIRDFVKEEQIVGLVVGLPLHLSGDESEKSLEARAYGAMLRELTGLPVALHDERFTSSVAEDVLLAANLSKKQRKARMDKLAAQLILKGYLDSRHQFEKDRLPIDAESPSSEDASE